MKKKSNSKRPNAQVKSNGYKIKRYDLKFREKIVRITTAQNNLA